MRTDSNLAHVQLMSVSCVIPDLATVIPATSSIVILANHKTKGLTDAMYLINFTKPNQDLKI